MKRRLSLQEFVEMRLNDLERLLYEAVPNTGEYLFRKGQYEELKELRRILRREGLIE